MDYSAKSFNPAQQKTACLVLPVFDGRHLSTHGQALDQATDGALAAQLKRAGFSAARGRTLLLLDVPGCIAERVLLIGCGEHGTLPARYFIEIAGAAAQALAQSGAGDACSCLTELQVDDRDGPWKLRQLVAAQEDGGYRFVRQKSKPEKAKATLRRLTYLRDADADAAACQAALDTARATALGSTFAKDLGNLSGNVCTPSYLAQQAKALGKAYKTLKVTVLDEADMKKMGMGTLLSVSRGSAEPARFIVMEYRLGSGKSKAQPVVLIGKGVTFDTGGISLKPGPAMDEMKYDMCGAASVLGTMKALAELDLDLAVVGIVAAVENMPGSRASKPGDIVTSLSGKTVEILNTDAEGRLILCDAITYSERYNPDVVVDIATLTGACVIALGKHPHGLFSNDQALADALIAAGERAHDRPWQMPLWPEYQQQLDSNFADFANIGGREAGAVTAACFLARFAENLRWAHLDIAGTAWLSGKQKGATGRPVPLLTQYLVDRAAAARSVEPAPSSAKPAKGKGKRKTKAA